jgi:hypothetical protein
VTNPIVRDPRAIARNTGSEVICRAAISFSIIDGMSRNLAPLRMPRRPWVATMVDERGSMVVVFVVLVREKIGNEGGE